MALPQIGEHATKQNVIHLSMNAEKQSFDYFLVLDRAFWPLKLLTPYPNTKDINLQTRFQTVFDPLEFLTFVAANTQKIILVTDRYQLCAG